VPNQYQLVEIYSLQQILWLDDDDGGGGSIGLNGKF
jgi:hypothetical protein